MSCILSNLHSLLRPHRLATAFLVPLMAFGLTQPAFATYQADLKLQWAATPRLPKAFDAGKTYSVKLVVSNLGPAAATNPTVTINLPKDVKASQSAKGCTALAAELVQCTTPVIAPNKKYNIAFRLKAEPAAIGTASLTAGVTAAEIDPAPQDNSLTTTMNIGSIVDIRVSTSGDADAKVTGPDGLDCGTSCQALVKSNKATGDKVVLQAIPGFRKQLVKWSGVNCAATPPFKCTIKTVPGAQYNIQADFGAARDEKVVLLLHGMNSDTSTWKDYVRKNFRACPAIDYGTIIGKMPKNAPVACYAVRFGAYDLLGEVGLDDARGWATANGVRKAGDFSSFEQLGKEVDKAVGAIKAYHPGAHVLLIGHSRGGLAGRAFFYNKSAAEPLNSLWTDYVDGLITTGTPHQGSPIGKIYTWLKNHPRGDCDFLEDCFKDWIAVDQLTTLLETVNLGLDARRPVIGYLASGSPQLAKLNSQTLPAGIATGQLRYGGLQLGILTKSYDIFPSSRSGGKSTLISTKLTNPAIDFMLGKGVNGDHPDLLGDGIVPFANQGFAEAMIDQPYANNNVLHRDEPKRAADINAMICRLNSAASGMTFANWVKCP